VIDETIKEIYNMLYSPVVTPYNLLDNARLENYDYVMYKRSDIGLVAILRCTVEPGFKPDFYYYFDQKDNLLKIIMQTEENEEVIFDRQSEIKKLEKKYKNEKANKTRKIAG